MRTWSKKYKLHSEKGGFQGGKDVRQEPPYRKKCKGTKSQNLGFNLCSAKPKILQIKRLIDKGDDHVRTSQTKQGVQQRG